MNSSYGAAEWGKAQPNNPHNTPMVPEGLIFTVYVDRPCQ